MRIGGAQQQQQQQQRRRRRRRRQTAQRSGREKLQTAQGGVRGLRGCCAEQEIGCLFERVIRVAGGSNGI
jgi:hypothetical protein